MFSVNVHDVVFVGSGASCTYALVNIIDSLIATNTPHNVAIVEKEGYFHSGKAYGQRSGNKSLVLTSLNEFLPTSERHLFISWFQNTHSVEFNDLIKDKYKGDKEFATIESSKIFELADKICIRRAIFGEYLQYRGETAIKKARNSGHISVTCLAGTVQNITKIDENHHDVAISTRKGDVHLSSRSIVLSVGTGINRMLPISDMASTQKNIINDIYSTNIDLVLRRASDAVIHNNTEIDVVIAGSNASALDVIFLLNQVFKKLKRKYNVTVTSKTGILPTFGIEGSVTDDDGAKIKLQFSEFRENHPNLTAFELFDFANSVFKTMHEIMPMKNDDRTTVDSEILKSIGCLSSNEMKIFGIEYANRLGIYKRRCAFDYAVLVDDLIRQGRMNIRHGAVSYVNWVDGRCSVIIEHNGNESSLQCDVFVNCSGSEKIDNQSSSSFLQMLINNNIVNTVENGIGFLVDDFMMSSRGVYVIGPMLAGNTLDDKLVWHVEHVGRIIGFAEKMSESYINRLGAEKTKKSALSPS